jgi:uncharacterized protein involved in exopolysaccharide biosynthesis
MEPQSDGLPLLSYALMVWRRRFLVLIVALGMAVPAFAVSAVQNPQHQATAQILFTQRQLDENSNVEDGVLSTTQINNQIAILTGPEVAERARQQGVTSPIQAVGNTRSNVVTLSTEDPDPRQAMTAVEGYVRAFSEYRTQQVRKTLDSAATQLQNRIVKLQEQIDKLPPAARTSLQGQQATVQAQLGRVQIQQGLVSSGIEVVQNPAVVRSPVSTAVRNTLLALVLGLALGISLAVLLETLQRRLITEPAASQTRSPDGASALANHDSQLAAPLGHGRHGRAPTPQAHEQ